MDCFLYNKVCVHVFTLQLCPKAEKLTRSESCGAGGWGPC